MKNDTSSLFNHLFYLPLLLIIIFLTACEEDNPVSDAPQLAERGDLVEANAVLTYSSEAVGEVVAVGNFQFPYDQEYSVRYVQIVYMTLDQTGKLSRASGGLFVPEASESLPLLSLQHGTEVNSANVASTSPLSSVEAITGLLTGSMGYVTAVPDYIGFGVSNSMHPYIHAESLSTEVIDFLRAVKNYCAENNVALNGQLFLGGYSEGGYATLAVQKDIEANYSGEFQITAAAPIAGPYDIAGTLLDGFQKLTYPEPAYVAYLFTAYNEIYGWDRLGDIFIDPYSSQVTGLFDGSKNWGEVINQLPDTMDELLRQDFMDDFVNGAETEIRSAFEDNTLLNWRPASPICFIHGTADQIVPFKNTQTAYENLSALSSAEIRLVPIPGGTHESSGMSAILLMLEYFEEFSTGLILAKAN